MFSTEQTAVIEHPGDRLRVEAGPGAGKTRVVAERIAHGLLHGRWRPSQVVALTFTRAMAADLKRRIAAAMPPDLPCRACEGVGRHPARHEGDTGWDCGECAGTGRLSVGAITAGTLHSLAAGWVRRALRGEIAGGKRVEALGWTRGPDFSIALPEDVDDFVAHAQALVGKKKITQKALREGLSAHGPALEKWPAETEARRQLWLRNLVTYDDLLTMLERIVEAPDMEAAPTMARLYPALFVDESQDLTTQHWRIIGLWAPRMLTTVGDDGQRIYGFLERGGRSGTAAEMREIVERGATTLTLRNNYRSGGRIVSACSDVRRALSDVGGCTPMTLLPMRDGGAVTFVDHRTRSAIVDPAEAVASAVGEELSLNDEPGSIVVLAPTWAELADVGAALFRRGIRSETLERGRGQWRSVGGRALVALARIADQRRANTHDAAVLLRALGRDALRLVESAESHAYDTAGCTLAAALDLKAPVAGMPDFWAQASAARTLHDVIRLADDALVAEGGGHVYDATAELGGWCVDFARAQGVAATAVRPEDFLLWLSSSDEPQQRHVEDVRLSTIHGFKGLEAPVVVIAGACAGNLPPRWVKTDDERVEWGRALYVAMSRASESVTVVCPTDLRGKPRHPSAVLIEAGLCLPNPAVPPPEPTPAQ